MEHFCNGCKKSLSKDAFVINLRTKVLYSRCEPCRISRNSRERDAYAKACFEKKSFIINEIDVSKMKLIHTAGHQDPSYGKPFLELAKKADDKNIQGVEQYFEVPLNECRYIKKVKDNEWRLGYGYYDFITKITLYYSKSTIHSAEMVINNEVYEFEQDYESLSFFNIPTIMIPFYEKILRINCDNIDNVRIEFSYITMTPEYREWFTSQYWTTVWDDFPMYFTPNFQIKGKIRKSKEVKCILVTGCPICNPIKIVKITNDGNVHKYCSVCEKEYDASKYISFYDNRKQKSEEINDQSPKKSEENDQSLGFMHIYSIGCQACESIKIERIAEDGYLLKYCSVCKKEYDVNEDISYDKSLEFMHIYPIGCPVCKPGKIARTTDDGNTHQYCSACEKEYDVSKYISPSDQSEKKISPQVVS